ncbi:hypothetical protein [Chitinivorax tropicus]|uniref:hypothetical protein n=1 Tax=Chitinivorax tropicus TaxID=714531 RepID=UPI001C850E7E|nr:hypothetical protein [Chitinivorax tropicus]
MDIPATPLAFDETVPPLEFDATVEETTQSTEAPLLPTAKVEIAPAAPEDIPEPMELIAPPLGDFEEPQPELPVIATPMAIEAAAAEPELQPSPMPTVEASISDASPQPASYTPSLTDESLSAAIIPATANPAGRDSAELVQQLVDSVTLQLEPRIEALVRQQFALKLASLYRDSLEDALQTALDTLRHGLQNDIRDIVRQELDKRDL